MWVAAVAMLVASACSSHEDEDTDEIDQTVTADWIHPACDAAALGPPANNPQLCNGGWTYSYRELWENPDACSDTNCTAYKACTSWDRDQEGDGRGYSVQSWVEAGPTQNWDPGVPYAVIEEGCRWMGIARRNALIATRPGISQHALAGFEIASNPSVAWFEAHKPYHCEIAIWGYPTQDTLPRPACGCAKSQACARGRTFPSTQVPKSIPDANAVGVTSALAVPAGIELNKLVASVKITHTYRGNLEIALIAPNGQVGMLSNRQGGSFDNYSLVGASLSGLFPQETPTGGTWTLRVRDLAAGDTGTIDSFILFDSTPVITAATTAPGAHIPALPAPSPGSLRSEFVQAPSCQTCDGIAIDTDAHTQAKFDCLDSGLSAATGPLQLSLAARIKLLLQVAGERLTPAQRTRAEDVYNEHTEASTACSTAITWNDSCPTDTSASHLRTQSQLCNDLASNPATSPGAAGAELTTCFAQLTDLGDTSDTCRLAMRDSADATALTLVRKAQPSFAGDVGTALKTAVSRINSWWIAATGLGRDDQAWLFEQSSVLERWLWQTIELQRNPLPVTNPTNDAGAVALLADVADTRLANDISFLTHVFSPGLQPSAPPLLTLTSDALKVLADRLDRLAPIHDVGCRFRPCKNPSTGVVTTTATSQLMRVLAALPDAAELSAALTAATALQSQLPNIYNALIKVRDQHQYLADAWNRYGREESFSQLALIDSPPLEAETLAAIVRNADVASASYQSSATFTPGLRPRLTASTLRQGDLAGFIDTAISGVDGDRNLFTTTRLETVKDLLDQSRTGAALQSQDDQIAELESRALDVAGRIDALEQRDATERKALTSFQSEFETLVNSGVLDANAAYQIQTLTPVSASAGERHFPNGGRRNVVRDRFVKVDMKPGEQLRVSITGQWAPSCAVSLANIVDPNTQVNTPVILDEALTGPEGYFVTLNGNAYHAKSVSNTTGGPVTESFSACMSSESGSVCQGASRTIPRPADTDTLGAEVRMSATFTSGVRLSTTPFPEAPAGSLVAVITRKGVTGGASDPPIVDIRVVQREDLFVAPLPSLLPGWNDGGETEIHFVVNDRAELDNGQLCPAATTQALQINLTRVIPIGNVAKQVGAAMAATLTAIEDQAQSIILTGELSGAEQTSLRADAWRRVQDALVPSGIGLSGLPTELRQLFDAFLERELASISRRAQSRALTQQLTQLGLQIGGIFHQKAFAQEQNRLLHLVPRWRLRDLSGVTLAASTARLANALTAYAAPIFELRDPSSFTELRSQIASNAQLVTSSLNITGRYEDEVGKLVQLARAVSGAVSGSQFELPTSQRRTIVVALPRPPGPGQPPWTGPWKTVSPTTSQAFWNNVFDAQGNLQEVTITLSPADIYSLSSGGSRLGCLDHAPVVRHLGLYFETYQEGSVLGPIGMEITTTAAITSPVAFPLEGRTLSFESTDPLGIPLRAVALNGGQFEVLEDGLGHPMNFGSWPAELGAGAGISPFTSFRLDMRAFGPPSASADVQSTFANTRAMYFVFDVERKTESTNAFVPGVCALP